MAMFDWTKMKRHLAQNPKTAVNLPAYGKDVNEFAGKTFAYPARGFRCNIEGIYAIYYEGMSEDTVPYVKEFCAAGMDYAGSIINIKTSDASPATIDVNAIIIKW